MVDTQKILFIGTVWPEPNSSAAGSRMMQLLHFFRVAKWDITFASSSMRSDFSADLVSLDIREVPILLNDSSFDDFVRVLGPDVVVFDRYMTEEQFGWRVAEACPTAIRILDTEDLHSLRSARKRALRELHTLTSDSNSKGVDESEIIGLIDEQYSNDLQQTAQGSSSDKEFDTNSGFSQKSNDSPSSEDDTTRRITTPISADYLLSDPIAVREVASIFRCDAALVISAAEITVLSTIFGVPRAQLCELPFFVDFSLSGNTLQESLPFAEREHFVSIGNFLHEPNFDAVLQLRNEIWPSIRKALPKAEMHVYGAYPSQKVHQLHKPSDGFFIKGRAENARDVISKARVMLAPLRFGAGLKGKLVEAMLFGTPAITTPIGAEGLQEPWNHRPYLLHQISDMGESTDTPSILNEDIKQDKSKCQQLFVHENFNDGNPSGPLTSGENYNDGETGGVPSSIPEEDEMRRLGSPLFVHDNYDGFIKDAISLYEGESRWNNAVEEGFTVVRNKFDVAKHGNVLSHLVHRLLENREASRRDNFIGKMLMHHTVASSKFMSRWIEEKNRKLRT